jgi:hypothetical protein
MRKKLLAALLAIIAIIAAFVIVFQFTSLLQNNNPSTTNGTIAKSEVEDGIQLSISLDANKTAFERGERINMTFALTNISNETKNFALTEAYPRIFNFYVFNSTNDDVSADEIGVYSPINTTIPLSPHESYNATFSWAQNRFWQIHPTQQVPAGNYYIIGFVNNHNQRTLMTEHLNITISK